MGAARLDLDEALANPVEPVDDVTTSRRFHRSAGLAWGVAATAVVASLALLAYGGVRTFDSPADERGVTRSTIAVPPRAAVDEGTQPALSPDGRRLAFIANEPNGPTAMFVRALDGIHPQRLAGTEGAAAPFWSPDSQFLGFVAGGKLKKIAVVLFVRDRTLMAQPFDTRRLALTGDAVLLAEDVTPLAPNLRSGAMFSVSEKGDLVYVTQASQPFRLVWRNRAGDQIETLDTPDFYGDMALSRDGAHVAIGIRGEIWLINVKSGARALFAAGPGNTFPTWSPGGDRIAFASRRQGQLDLFAKMFSSPLDAESLLFVDSLDKFPTSWSPDDRFILFVARSPQTDMDLWILPLNDDRKPYQFVHTRASETAGQFSPDGGWIAYVSDESRQAEVFVEPFPGPGDRKQISINGGSLPQWRGDGKEIFYRTPDNHMVATETTTAGERVTLGRSQTLFDMDNVRRGGMSWDVAPDGQRFLVVTPADPRSEASIGLLQNWPALLRQQ